MVSKSFSSSIILPIKSPKGSHVHGFKFTRFSFVGNESVSHISDPMNSVNYGNIGDASGSQMETQQSNALPSSVQSKQQRNPVSVLSTQVSEVVIDDFFYYIRKTTTFT